MNSDPHIWAYGAEPPNPPQAPTPTRTSFLVGESVVVRKTRKQGTVAAKEKGRYLVALEGRPNRKRWFREGELWDQQRWMRQQAIEAKQAAAVIHRKAERLSTMAILEFVLPSARAVQLVSEAVRWTAQP